MAKHTMNAVKVVISGQDEITAALKGVDVSYLNRLKEVLDAAALGEAFWSSLTATGNRAAIGAVQAAVAREEAEVAQARTLQTLGIDPPQAKPLTAQEIHNQEFIRWWGSGEKTGQGPCPCGECSQSAPPKFQPGPRAICLVGEIPR